MHYGKKASQWKQCDALGNVLLGNPAVHVTLTRTSHLSIVADHEHSLMETVFPDGSGLFQQDNSTKMVQERFEEHNNQFKVLTWPPKSPDLNLITRLWDVLNKQKPIRGGPTSQLTGIKGSAANISVPDTTHTHISHRIMENRIQYNSKANGS